MECCVGVSIETVLQVVKNISILHRNEWRKNIKKPDVLDCSPSLEWMHRLWIKRCLYSDVKRDNAMR